MNRCRLHWLLALVSALLFSSAGAQQPPGAGATQPAPEPSDSAAELNREVRTVEQSVDELKERVFRSKATLQLLRELVLDSSNVGSRVAVWHIDKFGPAYTIQKIEYFLDGKNIYTRADESGALDQEREIKLLEQAMPPGTHNLQVTIFMRGNGLGIFSYLTTYSFKLQSSYSFTVEDGKETTLRVIANERGGPWVSFVDRPSVQYDERSGSLKGTQ